MGNYATQADLKGRYEDDIAVAHLTKDEDTGVPDPAILDEVIDGAEGEVNSYLAARYLVPVETSLDTGVAAMLKSMTLDLACVNLELRSGDLTPDRELLWTKVLEKLAMIRDGAMLLPTPLVLDSTTARSDTSRFGTAGTSDSSNRLFTRATQERI